MTRMHVNYPNPINQIPGRAPGDNHVIDALRAIGVSPSSTSNTGCFIDDDQDADTIKKIVETCLPGATFVEY